MNSVQQLLIAFHDNLEQLSNLFHCGMSKSSLSNTLLGVWPENMGQVEKIMNSSFD